METQTTKKYITGLDAIADYLGVSKSTACRMKKNGSLNFIQIGRTILFDTENLFAEKKSSPRKK